MQDFIPTEGPIALLQEGPSAVVEPKGAPAADSEQIAEIGQPMISAATKSNLLVLSQSRLAVETLGPEFIPTKGSAERLQEVQAAVVEPTSATAADSVQIVEMVQPTISAATVPNLLVIPQAKQVAEAKVSRPVVPESVCLHDMKLNAISEGRQAVAIELCCGSAGFSASLAARGFKCIAVDYTRNRFRSRHAVTMLNLESEEAVAIVCEAIDQGNVTALLLAPPCGTASRAREIPLSPQQLWQLGGKEPRQLRSETEPWGLSSLTGLDLIKVQAANRVYVNGGAIVLHAIKRGVKPTVENPKGSYLWLLWPYSILVTVYGFKDVDFQHCRHGGLRPKWTRLRTLMLELMPMAGLCPGVSADHQHKPWGVAWGANGAGFATAEETEYPRLMCDTMADAAVESAVALGFSNLGVNANPDVHEASALQLRRMAGSADRSNTGRKPAPLVSEFETVISVMPAAVDDKRHRVLRTTVCKGVSGSVESVTVGVFREPEKFILEALAAKHPVDSLFAIPPALIFNIDWILKEGPVSVCKFRINFIKELVKLVHDNRADDDAVLATLSSSQQRILSGKKLATLQLLATRINHPDKTIVSDATKGFRLTGFQKYSGYFTEQVVVPLITEGQLKEAAKINNKVLLGKTKSSGDDAVDRELWELAMAEEASGWLQGPYYSESDVRLMVGAQYVVSRRFPLLSGKRGLRPIDDLNESGVNLAYGSCDRLSFHDVDVVAAVLNHLALKIVRRPVSFISAEWTAETLTVLGRVLDLKGAYKQWALNVDSLWTAVAAVYDPVSRRAAMFTQGTLPFGACSAVLNFNRLSRLAWEILVKLLHLIVLSFFDDYPMLEPKATARVARLSAEACFALLGWQVSQDPKKSLDFAKLFVALGVEFELSSFSVGTVLVQNKQDRADGVVACLEEVITAGSITGTQRDSLRGKLQYMERQVYGRTGKFVMRALDVGGRSRAGTCHLRAADVIAFRTIISWIRTMVPRAVAPTDDLPPLLLFTDGAEEGTGQNICVSCGALLIDPIDDFKSAFGVQIGSQLVAEWKRFGGERVINQAELLPVPLSKRVWDKRMYRRRVLCFVDNEAAKFCCVNMDSASVPNRDILMALAAEELRIQSWTWYSRVCSFSNPADPASRLDMETMRTKFGATAIEVSLPVSLLNGVWKAN